MSRNLQFFFALFPEFVLFFICNVTFDLFVEDQSVVPSAFSKLNFSVTYPFDILEFCTIGILIFRRVRK